MEEESIQKNDRLCPEIEIKHLNKTFDGRKVLTDINLTIEKGDIFGVLGLSGAGKSTLVRCLNGLENFDSGEVTFKGNVLCSPSHPITREDRRHIGMIFQSFNLLQQRTVLQNVELALELDKTLVRERQEAIRKEHPEDKKAIRNAKRALAMEALEKVGLQEKADSYPSQLSGGQCQRAAIARTLVLNPEVLLSDEATSALDPETTHSILSLLKDLNREYGITIIMISHQMNAIEDICNKVAIIDQSRIIETGLLSDVFLNPQAEITRKLIYANHVTTKLSNHHLVRILFEGNTDEPLISNIVQDCQIIVSIVYADTKVHEGKAYGQTLIKRPKTEAEAEKLFKYLTLKGFRYEEVNTHEQQ